MQVKIDKNGEVVGHNLTVYIHFYTKGVETWDSVANISQVTFDEDTSQNGEWEKEWADYFGTLLKVLKVETQIPAFNAITLRIEALDNEITQTNLKAQEKVMKLLEQRGKLLALDFSPIFSPIPAPTLDDDIPF